MVKTPPGRWGQHQMAALLGTTGPIWGRYLSAQSYPTLQMMQKIETVLGWPVQEQVQLIPKYWEWPTQARGSVPYGDPVDFRYAIKLSRVVAEWTDANPRTETSKDIRQHPDIKGPRGRGYYRRAERDG